ncbi:DUF4825 domain-containing protein [Guptibacillus algicola]|uniref:DUF4825 domain-containing protein n=1 Tax=Guptibacillus algicola TaxID=225844 RepID=UPI001CD74915|nr:DUF4825 domain-containing protein [Alkalihalobacillus algicola]MCA0988457.1 DUF4825 domain-containing protein [Alkalihalobacillus algicola]
MKRNKLVFTVILLVLISGCSSGDSSKEDFFQYNDSYIGDNGAVGAILRLLPGKTELENFSLQTKSEPYGLTAYYSESLPIEDQREAFLFNATLLFTLIHNAETVSAEYGDEMFSVTKDELEAWYGETFFEADSEEALLELTLPKLENREKVNEFFENQTGVNESEK